MGTRRHQRLRRHAPARRLSAQHIQRGLLLEVCRTLCWWRWEVRTTLKHSCADAHTCACAPHTHTHTHARTHAHTHTHTHTHARTHARTHTGFLLPLPLLALCIAGPDALLKGVSVQLNKRFQELVAVSSVRCIPFPPQRIFALCFFPLLGHWLMYAFAHTHAHTHTRTHTHTLTHTHTHTLSLWPPNHHPYSGVKTVSQRPRQCPV